MSDGRRAAQVKVDVQEREEITTPGRRLQNHPL